jgi:hypothetical protein
MGEMRNAQKILIGKPEGTTFGFHYKWGIT